MRLLLIEDDVSLCKSLSLDLEHAGFAVDMANDGEQGEYLGMTECYDIVVLDLGLPKLPGLEILKQWRQANNNVPVIVLTARDAWYEKVDGFKAGADDYLCKPFHFQELLVRIQTLIKRLSGQNRQSLNTCGIELNEDQQTLTLGDQHSVELTDVEFRLLRYFMLHQGKVISKTELIEHVYSCDHDPDSNVIEVYINRLRRKLSKDMITTRRGQGYVFGKS